MAAYDHDQFPHPSVATLNMARISRAFRSQRHAFASVHPLPSMSFWLSPTCGSRSLFPASVRKLCLKSTNSPANGKRQAFEIAAIIVFSSWQLFVHGHLYHSDSTFRLQGKRSSPCDPFTQHRSQSNTGVDQGPTAVRPSH